MRVQHSIGYKTGAKPAHEATGARHVGTYMDNMGGDVRRVTSDWADWVDEEAEWIGETPKCSALKKNGGECQAFVIQGSPRCIFHQDDNK